MSLMNSERRKISVSAWTYNIALYMPDLQFAVAATECQAFAPQHYYSCSSGLNKGVLGPSFKSPKAHFGCSLFCPLTF